MNRNEADDLQIWFDQLREKHGVVGASLALIKDGELSTAVGGILNQDTRIPVTTDSLFQVGSITKVFTATLLMQLVDEGRVGLDQPLRVYLPGFEIASKRASREITLRHLLCHTSGMEGDFFPEDDPAGPSIAGYVERCRLLPQLHEVGERFSYCNSGYTIAGHVVEVVTGRSWADAMRERILKPLGLQHSFVDPAEAQRYRVAMGHLRTGDALQLAPSCYLPLSHAPAGTVLTMSASDLLLFAQAHMGEGPQSPEALLSASSRYEMQQFQVALPKHSPPGMTHWGLGWILGQEGENRVMSHYGGTLGQVSYLRCIPGRRLAVAVLTNSDSMAFYEELEDELLLFVGGVELPRDSRQRTPSVQAAHFIGCYENIAQRIEIFRRGEGIFARRHNLAQPQDAVEGELMPIDVDCFEVAWPGSSTTQAIAFVEPDSTGGAPYLSIGFRLLRRVRSETSAEADAT